MLWGVVFEDAACDDGLVDLVGSVVDAGAALVSVPPGEGCVVGDAECAVDLDGAVEDALEDVCDVELDEGDAFAGGVDAVAVDGPGGVEGGEAGGVDLGAGLGDPGLDGLS